jgi:hypothetical protein
VPQAREHAVSLSVLEATHRFGTQQLKRELHATQAQLSQSQAQLAAARTQQQASAQQSDEQSLLGCSGHAAGSAASGKCGEVSRQALVRSMLALSASLAQARAALVHAQQAEQQGQPLRANTNGSPDPEGTGRPAPAEGALASDQEPRGAHIDGMGPEASAAAAAEQEGAALNEQLLAQLVSALDEINGLEESVNRTKAALRESQEQATAAARRAKLLEAQLAAFLTVHAAHAKSHSPSSNAALGQPRGGSECENAYAHAFAPLIDRLERDLEAITAERDRLRLQLQQRAGMTGIALSAAAPGSNILARRNTAGEVLGRT